MQSRVYPLDTVPAHRLRQFALKELADNPAMLPTANGIPFMASETSYRLFTVMRDMTERGETVTYYSLLKELLGYTVTSFDELNLIISGDMTYRSIDKLYCTPNLKNSSKYNAAMSRRFQQSMECEHAA